jgi:drug/metabolite transporter (DMT)-like permease
MSSWFAINDKSNGLSTLKNWRISCLVGITGVVGSYAWFLAFTLQNAAYVRALGQIELVFTFLASYFFLKEKNSQTEILGIFLIILSVFLILKSF